MAGEMHAASPRAPSRIIDRRYELGDRLGRGAHADVFAAIHVHTRREHALKLWRLALERPEDASRWKREILAPMQIVHPSIVPITDAGVDGGQRPFVVMDRLRGEDLSKRLAREPLSLDQTLDVFELLLDGLAAAHAAGIVHRDLKPANIFLERDGSGRLLVRLLDFGYALPLAQGLTRITSEGVSLGTVSYMAPEQASAAEHIGRAADVWASGVILYECLTGARPFADDDVGRVLSAIQSGDFVPVTTRAPATPPVLAAIVARCLTVSLEERYPDAGVVRDALAAARASRAWWYTERSLDDGDPPTKPLWSATRPPLPAYVRAAGSSTARGAPPPPPQPALPSSGIVPITRPRLVANAREPSGSHAAPSTFADAGKRSGWSLSAPLLMCAAALLILSALLFAGRDSLLVPLLSGNTDFIGYTVYEHRWTPAVNIAAAVAFALAALLGSLAAAFGLHARRRARSQHPQNPP